MFELCVRAVGAPIPPLSCFMAVLLCLQTCALDARDRGKFWGHAVLAEDSVASEIHVEQWNWRVKAEAKQLLSFHIRL